MIVEYQMLPFTNDPALRLSADALVELAPLEKQQVIGYKAAIKTIKFCHTLMQTISDETKSSPLYLDLVAVPFVRAWDAICTTAPPDKDPKFHYICAVTHLK